MVLKPFGSQYRLFWAMPVIVTPVPEVAMLPFDPLPFPVPLFTNRLLEISVLLS